MVLLLAGNIFPASNSYGDTTMDERDKCLFSIQLQSSPFREEYMAKLAGETGAMLAAVETDADSTEQSDMPYAFRMLFGKARTSDVQSDAVIDSFSKDCLTCHSFSAAVNVDFNYRNSPGNSKQQKWGGNGKDHPNGMDYQSYVALSDGMFKPVPLFNSKMIFVDGRVGCLTCHNPLNPEQGHLVMSDFRSALCETCHNR